MSRKFNNCEHVRTTTDLIIWHWSNEKDRDSMVSFCRWTLESLGVKIYAVRCKNRPALRDFTIEIEVEAKTYELFKE